MFTISPMVQVQVQITLTNPSVHEVSALVEEL